MNTLLIRALDAIICPLTNLRERLRIREMAKGMITAEELREKLDRWKRSRYCGAE